MLGDTIEITFLNRWLEEAGELEVFVPYKVYKKGSKVTLTGKETYLCLKEASELSCSNSHNWIRLS